MKTSILKGLLAAITSILFFSCSSSQEDALPPTPSKETFIPVSVGFTGEILNITEYPLARANDSKDWYYFQVYSKPEDSQTDNYTYYAYGFFDNKEDMVINLKTGYKYKFDVGMCANAQGKVCKFSLANAGWTPVGNTFFISSTEHVRYMYEGYLYLNKPYGTFDRPDIDRFFGETKDYSPKEGGAVEINMKRVSFGAKFVAKNFTEGSLEIAIEGTPTITMDATNGNEIEKIISFNNIKSAFQIGDEYSEEIPVNIVWVKPDNVRIPIANQKVEFKRNKLINIEFEVKENTTGKNFNINAKEELQQGGTISIENDGTNTGVNPKS